MMLIKVIVLITINCLDATGAFRCRLCSNAMSLDDCMRIVDCAPDEECYLDQIATEQLTLVYNGGCRAKDVCQIVQRAGPVIGRRNIHIDKRSGDRVICSHCCNTNATNGLECNTKMCGLQGTGRRSNQCYMCDSSRSTGKGDVQSPERCATLGTCQADEMCQVQQYMMPGSSSYKYSCANKRICTLLTKGALEDMKRCKDPAVVAAGGCGIGKRSGHLMCTACCGDARCNSGTCSQVLERLYNLWTSGLFDLSTLIARPVMTTPIGG